ncbi:nuclear transport factor 2 family protein [bacterium]|nr:nuclear transport factor 2 family protein [bacterium]MBP9808512.1 nuclear transport factor 2 family protein [bacterium]
MTVQNVSATLAAALSLSIAVVNVCCPAVAKSVESGAKSKMKDGLGKPGKKTKQLKETFVSDASGTSEAALKSRLQQLTVALASSDAKALSALWLEDGTYSNENGQQWRGRAALEKRFTAVFASEGRLLLDFVPVTVRQLAGNVATVDGFVKFKDEPSGSPDTRFSMVFQKQANGSWLIVSASETAYVGRENLDRLKSLAWLIGEWVVEKDGSSMVVKSEWAANKKFIHLRYMLKKAGGEELDSQQIIGFDPRRDQIVSWTFDSRGGFGFGVWSRRDNQWLVDSEGVDPEGRSTSATNIIANQTAKSFSWQSVNRSVEGEPFSDTAALTIIRR